MHLSVFIRTTATLLVVFLLLLTIIQPQPITASNQSPWSTGQPTLSQESSISPSAYSELRAYREGIGPTTECVQRNIKIQSLGYVLNRYKNTCWHMTSIGLISSDGLHILRDGESIAGELGYTGHSRNRPHLYPTANQDVFVEVKPSSSGGGTYWSFRTPENIQFDEDTTLLGAVKLTLKNEPSLELRLESGHPIIASHTTSWWSGDGKNLLVWHERNGSLYRVNMDSMDVHMVNVKTSSAKLIGAASLSANGRYAAVTVESPVYKDLVVIDYESCTDTTGPYITVGTDCDTTSYKPFLEAEIQNFSYPTLPRFYDNHTLGFYHRSLGSNGDHRQYLLQAHDTTRQENKYVALGDSYSSGEGAGDYEPGTDVRGVNMCHTSRNSYPYLIDRQLNLDSFFSVACSGAKIEHVLTTKQWEVLPSKNLGNDLHPGNKIQYDRVFINQPNISTMTMSGNDIGFSNKLVYCLIGSSKCYATYEKRLQIANEILDKREDLIGMYRRLMKDMGTNPRLYVVGYPQIASTTEGAQCAANVQLNEYQRNMANDLITFFNAVIKSAADESGAYYVGIENSLSGHKLCENISANVAVNGLTYGDDNLGSLKGGVPVGAASFHPNELGHQLIKNTILQRTNNLTATSDIPASAVEIPNPEDYPFLDVPSNGEQVRKLYYNPKAKPSLIQRGIRTTIKIFNPGLPLIPDAIYDIVLHSDPVYLGEAKTDGAGYIQADITIPESTPPGMHELHIQGYDIYGNPIDVYEFIYVAASENDFNGNGIADVEEPCGPFITPSDQDIDEDGIDDGCDAVISPKPANKDSEETDGAGPYESASMNSEGTYTYGPYDDVTIIHEAPSASRAATKDYMDWPQVASATDSNRDVVDEHREYSYAPAYYAIVIGFTFSLVIGYSVFKYEKKKARK